MPENRIQEDAKKYNREDIALATTVGDALHAYRKVSAEFSSYAELVRLQTDVADKMHELGDEDKAYGFTLLANQTRNTERNANVVSVFEAVVDDFNKKVNRFVDSVEDLGTHLSGTVASLRDTSESIMNAAGQMDQAANKIIDNTSK